MLSRALFAILIVLPLVAPASAVAAPAPPCGRAVEAASDPPFGSPGDAPHARIWTEPELAREHWQPPDCLHWSGETKLVVAVAGTFRATADVFDRMSDISAWPGIKYWSVTRQQWRPLVLAAAVVDAAGKHLASTLAGLQPGQQTLFVERAENSGDTTYSMRVLERSERRMVVAVDNVSPIKVAILTVFEPGALQTVTFVEHEEGDLWRTYQITRVGSGGSSLALRYQGSFLNRLEAVRRYAAGLPTDQEPPLARH